MLKDVSGVSLKAVGLDEAGHLFVCPGEGRCYALIYRAASGLQWNEAHRAVVASQPERWRPAEFLAHVLATVEDEFGDRLVLNGAAQWINVDHRMRDDLRQQIARRDSR